MKFSPKVLLGIALFLAILLIYQIKNPRGATQLKIEAHEDYFKVGINVTEKDQPEAQKALERLSLGQHLLAGFEFELDSTSSARLAFTSPILVNLKFQKDQINFAGQMAISQSQNLIINPSLKIPKNTTIGVFAHDFKKFAQKQLQDQPLVDWYDQNFQTPGQYLIAQEKGEFVIIATRSDSVSFDDQLAKLESFELAPQKTIDLHILKSKATFFQISDNLYFASSPKSAKDFLNAQVGNAPQVALWDSKLQEVSAAAFWQRQETSSQEDLQPFLDSEKNIAKYLENIDRVTIIQRNDKFEGSIKFK